MNLHFFLWMQGKVKCSELRTKDKKELLKQLDELKTELTNLRVAKVTGGAASKLSKMLVSVVQLYLLVCRYTSISNKFKFYGIRRLLVIHNIRDEWKYMFFFLFLVELCEKLLLECILWCIRSRRRIYGNFLRSVPTKVFLVWNAFMFNTSPLCCIKCIFHSVF